MDLDVDAFIILKKLKKHAIMSLVHEELTATIIGVFYDVYNKLGYGFLESVYENAMMIELEKIGLGVEQQVPIKIFYDKKNVGNFFADILVENAVILELKAVSDITLSLIHI